MTWDVFVSYASEDRAEIARPIATHLLRLGLRVWFDELALQPGDRLRQAIDEGLARSQYVIVVFSPAYLMKNWTRYELDGIVQRFVAREATLIPVWHNVTRESVATFSPTLADVVALQSAVGPESVAIAIQKRIGRDHQPSIELVEAFRGTIERDKDLKIDWPQILRAFATGSRVFAFVAAPQHSEHERGVGGYIESIYRLTDQGGNTYFELRHRIKYMTTADDFVDYSEPSLVTVNALLPLMTPLVETIAQAALA